MFYQNEFYKNLLEQLEDGVYFVDPNRKILFWNKAAEHITGFTKGTVEGCYCHEEILCHVDEEGRSLCNSDCPLVIAMKDGKERKTKVYLHHRDGYRVPVLVRSIPLSSGDGMGIGAVEIFTNETEKTDDQDKIKELAKLAYLDQATQLPNQNYLRMKLQSMHQENQISGLKCGLILIRVDNLKAICDQYQSDIANKSMAVVKNTLCHNLKSTFINGRWDDNSFLCIIPEATIDMAKIIAQKLHRLIESSSISFPKGAIYFQVSSKSYVMDNNDDFSVNMERFRIMPFLK